MENNLLNFRAMLKHDSSCLSSWVNIIVRQHPLFLKKKRKLKLANEPRFVFNFERKVHFK